MPSVLIGPYLLRNAPGRFRDILTEAGFEPIDPQGGPALSREELLPYLPRIDAMIAGGERMTPDLFAMAPRLRAIARTGVGYDLIDLAAATQHRVAVTHHPGHQPGERRRADDGPAAGPGAADRLQRPADPRGGLGPLAGRRRSAARPWA